MCNFHLMGYYCSPNQQSSEQHIRANLEFSSNFENYFWTVWQTKKYLKKILGYPAEKLVHTAIPKPDDSNGTPYLYFTEGMFRL
jgi:hypothetical protein